MNEQLKSCVFCLHEKLHYMTFLLIEEHRHHISNTKSKESESCKRYTNLFLYILIFVS